MAMNMLSSIAPMSVPVDPLATVQSVAQLAVAKKVMDLQVAAGTAVVQQLLDPNAGHRINLRA